MLASKLRKRGCHHVGVEGTAGLLLEGVGERLTGEYLRELHVSRCAGDDAALERDLVSAQAGGIARPVEALLVGAHELGDLAHARNAAHHALAGAGVPLVGQPVARTGRADEREDAVSHDNCAYIV